MARETVGFRVDNDIKGWLYKQKNMSDVINEALRAYMLNEDDEQPPQQARALPVMNEVVIDNQTMKNVEATEQLKKTVNSILNAFGRARIGKATDDPLVRDLFERIGLIEQVR